MASAAQSPRDRFIEAACVPREGDHRSGTLEVANALLAAHPEIATSDIHTAAILGDEDAVRRFLAADARQATAKTPPHDWDALTHLCFSNYLRLDGSRSERFVRTAAALLDAGASANTGWFETSHQPKPCWESALYGAAGVAHHAALTRLLLARGADPNDEETPYHTPETYDNGALHALVESGRLEAGSLTTLLLRKADWHDREGIAYLLEHGANANQLTRWHFTAFQQALRRDNALEIIETFLDYGADPALALAAGWSGFAIAARRGRGDVLALFESRGIPVMLEGVDSLLAACAQDNASAIRDFARREPALVRELAANGGTVLADFAGNGNTEGVGHLLDLGVPVTVRHEKGDGYYGVAPRSTALHVAAWRARHATVRLLIARGAPIDEPDGAGRTALMLAVRACVDSYWKHRRSPESVAALLDAGASIRGVPFPSGYPDVDELLRRAR